MNDAKRSSVPDSQYFDSSISGFELGDKKNGNRTSRLPCQVG